LGTLYEDIFLAYKQNNQLDSAYKYLLIASQIKDSLYKVRIANLSAFQNVSFEETLRLESLESEQLQTESKIRIYSLLAGLMVVSVIGIILFRNNNQRKKSNLLLTSQKNEIEQQKKQVEESMERLQSTQSQLVQAEKMASLGELTAGIAHEIQNPLNFVNNFSEVSTELVKEMVQEVDKGNTDEVKAIANDVVQNLEKINHHGQRASDIVKGMLQHSRSSSGVKEPTDINALADEYFRLAYHGLRAKDKTFNATMKTDFDESIGKISIIPQDIGRVVLNLITNAFYAVNEKSKQGIADYEPTVSVVTKKVNHQVEIRVADNGNGISANIVDKIFQPFFTTKPTGQGTGLGLSLSYDIVKAHVGELRVETREGIGSELIIQLPIV
jgi:signal transduction histidine kinase